MRQDERKKWKKTEEKKKGWIATKQNKKCYVRIEVSTGVRMIVYVFEFCPHVDS